VRHGSKASWWRGAAGAMMTAAALSLVLSACQGNSGPAGSPGSSSPGGGAAASPSAAGPKVTITPDTGARGARPDRGITVTADGGTISDVTVKGGAGKVEGSLNDAKTEWHSQWALSPGTRYKVTAIAADADGHQVTQTSRFRTLAATQTFGTQIFEGYHQTYGVGMPIMLTFSAPIKNKVAVEKAMQITTSKPVVGAWYWDGDQKLNFRPRGYWPAHTKVSFVAHLDGVHAGPGLWGTHTLTQDFSIGRSLVVVASTAAHHLKIFRDGKLTHTWPISTGKPGDDTPNGTYVTIEKGNPVEMKGPGYDLQVPFSVRITWSGIYLHDAPWSTGAQGSTNVSHGCVNMAPADAELYYNMELTGDPVTIMGSSRAGEWGNGWTDWFLPWPKYLDGSALHQAVEAGPDGSSFVSPSALPPYTGASAPIGGPPYGSANAA
jgi:lipoprotein-anchoring transpeptidase ErfK/SrfK